MQRLKRHWRRARTPIFGAGVMALAGIGLWAEFQPTASSTNQAEAPGLTATQVHPSPVVGSFLETTLERARNQGYSDARSAIYGSYTSPETGITYYAVVARASKDGQVTEVGFHVYVKGDEIVQVD